MSEMTNDIPAVAAVNAAHAVEPAGAGPRAWRWLLRLIGQARRQYLSRLRPAYVARLRAERLGQCRCCGSCCDLTFHCPYLGPEKRCTHYEKRTLTCRDFPLDALDLRLTRVPCGHYFAEPSEAGSRANSAG